ncbi:MAG: c-type cytochrome [Acidimicrobiia bacterium]
MVVAAACAPSSPAPDAAPEEVGRVAAERAGCFACHTTDGRSSTGPTWLGLFGSEVELVDGRTVTADEEYLRRSIVDPLAEVVDGYRPTMPSGFGDRLSEEEIQTMIAYIRSLS